MMKDERLTGWAFLNSILGHQLCTFDKPLHMFVLVCDRGPDSGKQQRLSMKFIKHKCHHKPYIFLTHLEIQFNKLEANLN